MKRKARSFISTIAALFLVVIATGGVASSMFEKPIKATYAEEEISYISRSWNGTKIVESEETCTVYNVVNSGQLTWSTNWYVLKSNVTFEDFEEPITIGGNVNLILMDGYTLTVNSYIAVNSGNTLNIYSQSGGTGALNVTKDDEMGPIGPEAPGIGGDEFNDCGTINIYGGNITANSSSGAGIGGSFFGNGGNITIYGGTINATSRSGAGIGGGPEGAGGTITIYGGNITALSTEYGAGIGGGNHESGGNITIHDGVVTAKGNSGAAIGGGSEGAGGTITINGGTVTATNLLNAAGIGGGQVASGGTINITGGTVYATGGAGASGIGGGDFGNYGGTGGNVTISGGTVYATGGSGSVGIGAGKNSTEHGSLVIDETSLGVYGGDSQNPTTRIYNDNNDYARYRYMIVKVPHEHNWSYVSNGNIITATCSAPGCALTDGLTLTLVANDSVYDGTAKTASFTSGYSQEAFGTPSISYFKNDVEVTECVSAGTYEARVTIGGVTAIKAFTVSQATPTPEVPTGLVATYGDKLSSVALPTNWAWKNPEDSVGDAGDRTHVAIYTPTDPNYKAIEANIIISVAQATPTPEVPTGLVATYGDTLSSVALPTNWAWKVPTDEVGDVGDRTHVAIYTPTDPNYKAVEKTITVSVSQATPTGYDIPTGLEATYGDKLSSVTLPSDWAWKNPEDSVGDAGNREHIAIYTPTDTNYQAIETNIIISVVQATPTPEVPTGLVATYGDTLSSVILPSDWAWKVPTDEVGDVGDRTHVAIYTPTDSNYKSVEKTITVSVSQATPTPEVPTGLEATYGDTLSSVKLPDTWAWKNPNDKVGDVGDRTHVAIYTPVDPNYKAVEKTITVSVSQATPTPEVPTGLVATYGDTLSIVKLPDTWAWKNPEDSVGNAGNREHIAIYTPTDPNYKAIEANVIISVAQAAPTGYDIPTGLEATYGDTLSSVTLPSDWAWKVPTDEVGDVGDRTHVAIYTPTDTNYKAVENILTVAVAQATPTGYDIPTGLEATYGDTLSSVTLPSDWAWKNPEDSVGNAGNREHIAIYTPTDPNYKAVENILTVAVAQATPTGYDIPTGLVATYGDTLSSVALPTNWAWKNPNDKVGDVGNREHIAIYTPTDPNYKAVEKTITVSVSQATPTPEVPTGLVATYGDKLSSVALPANWAWKNPEDSVGNAGNREHIAIYTPTDPNYKAVESILTVAVAKANPSVPTLDTIEAPCGVALSTIELPEGFSWMDGAQKTSTLGENTFKVKYTPADQANYNVVENIDVKVNVKWVLEDPTQGGASVTINGDDEVYIADISVKVEVKTEVTVDEKRNEYASLATEDFVKPNEDIFAIYEVELIRTTSGVEEEIQPSDIKPGTKITVSMAIPEELVGKDFRLLHIHSGDDITEVTNYTVSKDGKTLTIEVDRLSEFAFIGATDKDNGFIYNSTPIWALILLIIFSIILLVGIYCLYRLIKDRNDNSNNGDKSVKTMSVAFVSPILLAYSGLNGIIIAFIIVAALSVIVWTSNLCLFISNKKKKEKLIEANNSIKTKEDVKPVEEVTNDSNEDEEEVVTVKDEKGNIFQIRFIKSFTAKLIQSPEETKKYYEELKNEVLSYKKTTSRISWHFDSINSGRNQVLKFAIRGKTLCVYLSLNADDYTESKYKVEKVESKKFEEVPCLYRIKNDRRCEYAKELIAVVCERLGLVKGEEQHESYANLPYEENKPLIARGLIKELKVQVTKPVSEPEILEAKVNADGDEIVVEKDASGNIFEIRFVKSFTAKLSQSEDETKNYYSILKNYVLSYKDVHSRISWHHDAVNLGRDYVLKFAIRGKTLCVYFALDASTLDEKYKVEEAKGKKFEEVPVLYRIKNDRRCEYAKQLIDLVMSKYGLEKGEEANEDYRIKYESTKALLAKGLIKEVKTKVQNSGSNEEHYESITVEQADKLMSDEKAEASLEEDTTHHRREGKKEIINIDILSQNFNDGDEVTLDSLIEKKLISPKVGYVKVLGRGVLDKKLIVILNDYSLQAVKMIVLTGGHVRKINN